MQKISNNAAVVSNRSMIMALTIYTSFHRSAYSEIVLPAGNANMVLFTATHTVVLSLWE